MVQKQTNTVHMHLPECQYLRSGTVGSQGSSDSLLSVGSYNYTMEVICVLTKSPSNRVLIRDLKKVFFVENTISTKCCLGSGSQNNPKWNSLCSGEICVTDTSLSHFTEFLCHGSQ